MIPLFESLYEIVLGRPVLGAIAGVIAFCGLALFFRKDELEKLPIPRYGSSFPLVRTYNTLKTLQLGPSLYLNVHKHSSMMLLPRFDRWLLMVDATLMNDLLKAPTDALSFKEVANNYSLGYNVAMDHWHVATIRNELTRQLIKLFPDIYDEIQFTVANKLNREKPDENGWRRVKAVPYMLSVVAATANRVFVGVPLCRNEEWIKLNENAVFSVITVAAILNLFSPALRPIIGYLISPEKRMNRKASGLMGNLVNERLAMDDEERPNDLITWLIRVAPENEKNTEDITRRITAINFASLHTTSMTSTQALYWLMARPEYIQPLRDEILEVTAELGWTKEGINEMHKLDSFLAESSRMTALGAEITQRMTLQPFTFSNGVTVPKGTMVASNMWAIHNEPANYDHSTEFDGFRWLKEDEKRVEKDRKEEGKDGHDEHVGRGHASRMVTVSKTYLPFGTGKFACPGRFFAATEIKALFAHLIVHYDMKWATDSKGTPRPDRWRPENVWFGTNCTPNPDAEICMRRREI